MSLVQRVSMGAAVAALLLTANLASAGDYGKRTECKKTGAVQRTGSLKLRPFVGHDLQANYDLCYIRRPDGFVGPIANEGAVVFASEPVIRTPDKFPGAGIAETLRVIPGNWQGSPHSIAYRFEVKQQVAKVIGEQSFNVELKVSPKAPGKKIQMCFRKTCTSKNI